MKETPHERVRELVMQNAQKGEVYRVMFRGDPVTYEGMPVALPGMTTDTGETFEFKVLSPEDKKGVQRRSIHDVAWMEQSK